MKKILLFPTLLAISATPFISLSACNKGGNEPVTKYHYITFDTNGGSEIETVKVEENKTLKQPENPTKSGYEFGEWYTDASLTSEYDFDTPVTKDFTLYASWSGPIEYTITYHYPEGAAHTNPTTYTVESDEITLSDATLRGYEFDGWHKGSESGEKIEKIPHGSTGNLDLYTTATICTYDITYVLNGGDDKGDNPNTYTINDSIVLKNANKNGYEFDSWHLQSDLLDEAVTGWNAGDKIDDITLYAKWGSAIQYTITYKNIEPDEHPDDPETYTIESPTITFSTPARENWIFKGWYTDSTFKTPIKKIEQGSTGNITLYAKFVINKTLEACSWDEIKAASEAHTARESFGDPGVQTKKVQLKHQDLNENGKIDDGEFYQTVRIIGYDHDKDNDGNPIGITFEFQDLISDANGYSLAVQWNDTLQPETGNWYFGISRVRAALVGSPSPSYFWAEKNGTTWSSTFLGKEDNVLNMLPELLKNALKEPTKYVAEGGKGDWVDHIYNDPLFLLTPREMGLDDPSQEQKEHTPTYEFYIDCTQYTEEKRIKSQLSDEIGYQATIPKNSGQLSNEYDVKNFAGYNVDQSGGVYWLRSPFQTVSRSFSWCIGLGGIGTFDFTSLYNACALAPAFCI